MKKFSPYFLLLAVSTLLYIVHSAVLRFLFEGSCATENFLATTYAFFLFASAAIIFLLSMVKKSNIDYVGYAFLLLTCIKMAGAFGLYSYLKSAGELGPGCKINFFIAFLLFLGFETYAAIGMLNRK